MKLENLVENRIQGVFLDLGLSFPALRLIRQKVDFDVTETNPKIIFVTRLERGKPRKNPKLTGPNGSFSCRRKPNLCIASREFPKLRPCNCIEGRIPLLLAPEPSNIVLPRLRNKRSPWSRSEPDGQK